MSERAAKTYYQTIDNPKMTPNDLAGLYSDDALLLSPREGAFRGRDQIEEFYELNVEFFSEGTHHMTDFYVDGASVVCEGTVDGETTAGRSYEGIGLVDVMKFNDDDEITNHRVYLDYSGIYSQLPDKVPSYRELRKR